MATVAGIPNVRPARARRWTGSSRTAAPATSTWLTTPGPRPGTSRTLTSCPHPRRAARLGAAGAAASARVPARSPGPSGNPIHPPTHPPPLPAPPLQADFHKQLAANLGQDASARILAFKQKAPAPPEGYENAMSALYTANSAGAAARPRKPTRAVPQQPERILDAPDMLDDYYLNLVDWGASNTVRRRAPQRCEPAGPLPLPAYPRQRPRSWPRSAGTRPSSWPRSAPTPLPPSQPV